MIVNIQEKLRRAEIDFLTAISEGEEALSLYEKEWTSLQNSVEHAISIGTADREMLSAGRSVAAHISSIADCFLQFDRTHQLLKSELFDSLDDILKGVTSIQLSPDTADGVHPEKLCRSSSSSSTQQADSLPSFIAPAYEWLLRNLHNPYPSSDFKRALAKSHRYSPSSIDSWFINVRRRMGWTALCRDHFHNCRTDTVDAAYRALVEEDSKRLLPANLVHAFTVMKVAAEGLYSSVFSKSTLAGDLDAVLKDLTHNGKRMPQLEGCLKLDQSPETGSRRSRLAVDSYPSPHLSRPSSPVPSLDDSFIDESEDDEDVLPPTVAGRKRRSSSVSSKEPCHRTPFIADRPLKRLRSEAPVASKISVVPGGGLPSPPLSVESGDDDSVNEALATTIHAQISHNRSLRKRRLSDAGAGVALKRPCGSIIGTPLHSVSDPLPRNAEGEYSIDEWFNTNFDALFALPPPVVAVEPDSSAQWEIEIFRDYSIPPSLPKRTSRSPSVMQDGHNFASPDLTGFEDIFQSIGNNGLATSLDTISSTADPVTLDPSPSASEVLQSTDLTSLLQNTKIPELEVTQSYTVPQPLSEIDLSMLQLPYVVPMTTSLYQPRDVSKQAKLRQLQAMQEAVRRIERELESEGVAF